MNYHNNTNPDIARWGQGLYRYTDDDVALRILKDIVVVKAGTPDEAHAEEVIEAFIGRNRKNG